MSLARSPKRRHRNSARPAHKSAPGFLKWLRGCDCVIGIACEGPIVSAHVDRAGDKGMATKVSDRFAIPLCDKHHRISHAGAETFEAAYEIDMLATAERHWKAWPGRYEWERKLADG